MRYDRQIFLITLLICAAASVAFCYLYHIPTQLEIRRLEQQRILAAQQSVDILNFKNQYGNLDELILELDAQRADVDRALPPRLNQGDFINYIQSAALEHQIRLSSIAPGPPSSDESRPVTRLPIRLQINCSYFELLNFLNVLEDSERLINIENFTATSTDDGARLNCALDIVLFAADKENDPNVEIPDRRRVTRSAIDRNT